MGMAQSRLIIRIACAAVFVAAGIGMLAVPMPATPIAWLCAGPLIGAGIGALFRRPLLGAAIGVPSPIFAILLLLAFLIAHVMTMGYFPSPSD
jgi:hypothetical protein